MKPLRIAQAFFAGCLLFVALSQLMLAGRTTVPDTSASLGARLPATVGAWKEVPTDQDVIDPSDAGAQDSANQLYDRIEYHTYARADGAKVLLTLAYRHVQEQESKIHRPELCYFAQGFVISRPEATRVATHPAPLPAVTFRARNAHRSETVMYWIRIGDIISTSAWKTRLYLVRLGLSQRVPDGLLVRASMENPADADAATHQQNIETLRAFLGALVDSAKGDNRAFLAGKA